MKPSGKMISGGFSGGNNEDTVGWEEPSNRHLNPSEKLSSVYPPPISATTGTPSRLAKDETRFPVYSKVVFVIPNSLDQSNSEASTPASTSIKSGSNSIILFIRYSIPAIHSELFFKGDLSWIG